MTFLFKEEIHKVIGCAMEVINTIGHGLLEKTYENSLVVEFKLQKIPFQQQPHFPVTYKLSRLNLRRSFISQILMRAHVVIPKLKTGQCEYAE